MPRSFIEGQAAYVNLLSAEGSTYARGIVVEWTPESVVVAVDPAPLRREPQMEVGSTPIVFVKVTAASLHAARPEGWEEVRALQPWPDPRLVVEAFNSSDGRADQVETESDMQSAAETVTQPATKASSAAASAKATRLQGLLSGMGALFGDDGPAAESDEEWSEAESTEFLRPGAASAASTKEKASPETASAPAPKGVMKTKSGSKSSGDPFEMMLNKALGAGELDLKDLLMLQALRELTAGRRQKTKRGNDSSTDSSEGDGGSEALLEKSAKRSLRAVHEIRKRVHKCPRKVVKKFERMITKELGVGRGQPWSLRDWRRLVDFGNQRALPRVMEMLIEIYELLRAEKFEVATAQTAQSLKAIGQVALSQGDWRIGWAYTGLTDPLGKLKFTGTPEEALAITSHLSATWAFERELMRNSQRTSYPPAGSEYSPPVAGAFEEWGEEAQPKQWPKKKPKGKAKAKA